MEKIFFTFLFLICLFTESFVFGQYTASSPQTFQTYLSNDGNCPNLSYRGNIYYDIQSNKIMFCTGANSSQSGSSVWANSPLGIFYSSGKVGIGTTSPIFDLEMGSDAIARFENNVFVADKVGINTNTPNHKLEILDKNLTIRSSSDNIQWSQGYANNPKRFEIHCSNGLASFCLNSAGNVGIRNQNPTFRLSVEGSASFADNVTSSGKGLLQNSNSTQLKFDYLTVAPPKTIIILGNSCATLEINIENSYFTSPPTVSFAGKYNDGLTDDNIIITIEQVTASTLKLRFCNNSSSTRTISNNEGYKLMFLGEGS